MDTKREHRTHLMANRGKETCKQLKSVRRKIAEENSIPLEIPECTFEGECRGTCPRCEAEVRYLERELARRIAAGKAVAVAGIAAATLAVASCNNNDNRSNDTQSYYVDDESEGYAGVVTLGEPEEPIESPSTIQDDWDYYTAPDGSRIMAPKNTKDWDYKNAENVERSELVAEKPEQDGEEVYIVVDTDPKFPGGFDALAQYLADNVRYPKPAIASDITGKVYVTFVVEKDGSITNVKLLRDIGGGCGEEAVRAVKAMPKWTPGKQNGQAVRTQFNLPVKFPPSTNSEK